MFYTQAGWVRAWADLRRVEDVGQRDDDNRHQCQANPCRAHSLLALALVLATIDQNITSSKCSTCKLTNRESQGAFFQWTARITVS